MMGSIPIRNQSLRIAINAQILPNSGSGGVESVLIGLVHELGRLNDGPEEYVIIGPWQDPDWLKNHLGPNQRIVRGPQPPQPLEWKAGPLEPIKHTLGSLRAPLRAIWRELFPIPLPSIPRIWPEVPVSDGFYEMLGCDIIHFPWQSFILCALPSIYNPHDLQHLHYPQFFTLSNIAWRETIFPAGCHFAQTIVVGSDWVKKDIVRHYRVDPDKIQVIPWAPPTQVYPEASHENVELVKSRYKINYPFAFFPAMIWEHKNHLRLLEALAYLRDQEGIIIRLVCTGYPHPDFWPRIEECLDELNLDGQVRFLGIVPTDDLRSIYRLAQFVIVPTLFEAASGPIYEAWQEGRPVACSNVTSLPEQAGDAALLFDPISIEAIANAMKRMAMDENLRDELVRKGYQRLQDFSWERTAKAYRAVYRQVARRSLADEDRWLLSWDWMRDSKLSEKGVL